MSKTKKTGIPHYELLYIISNQYTEDEAKLIIAKVSDIIEKKGGKITKIEEWGKKRLAYKIKTFSHGYYVLVEFDIEGKMLTEVDRTLRMTSDVLRHMIVTRVVKTAEQIEKEKKIAEKIAVKAVEEKKEEEEKVKTKDKKKIDLGDLDEKLDKILDTGDLL